MTFLAVLIVVISLSTVRILLSVKTNASKSPCENGYVRTCAEEPLTLKHRHLNKQGTLCVTKASSVIKTMLKDVRMAVLQRERNQKS